MKKAVIIVAIFGIGATSVWYTTRDADQNGPSYRFVTVERGDLEAVVSSTGNLRAVTTVRVGTQVSGIVNRIYVDFNDRVRKGQLIAKIDTTLLVSAIRDARANLERNRAQVDYSKSEFERINNLYEKNFSTKVEINKARYDVNIAEANLKSANVNLERAERNLSYATIYSPIDGVVIERNVDLGQTVAASLSAPQLFLIANDLSRLQILASVDESDIGSIKEGQTARFTVQAYDEDTFSGIVRQVRLQSTIQENVVTYTAVVDVDNSDGRLLPGMTATVDFLIEKATDVFTVPNAALRFRPPESMMTALRERFAAQRAARSDSGTGRPGAGRRSASDSADQGRSGREGGGRGGNDSGGGGFGGGGFGRGGFGGGRSNTAMLWYLDNDGNPTVLRVRTGISNGQSTEINGRNLEDGLEIITGVTSGSSGTESTNPFQSNQSSRRRPGGF